MLEHVSYYYILPTNPNCLFLITKLKIVLFFVHCYCYFILCSYRRISGAMIRISNTEEHEASGKMERAITISGQADAVNVAKTLINLRLIITNNIKI